MSNLRRNLGYQTAYQILATCVPLITAPYLSRVLGAEGLGIYSYTYSNLRYFTLFALMGVAQYGMREIAQNKMRGREEVSKTFWSIYLFQLACSLVVILIYILFCMNAYGEYRPIAMIQVLCLLANASDISWLYFGLEQFKVTVTRNVVIKLLTTLSYFLFVRKPQDLYTYTVLSSVSLLVSSLVLWVTLPKHISFARVSLRDICRHIRPNMLLFIPSIASSVYHVMDKTMIGLYSNMLEEGYYYNADKVVNIPLTVVNGCCTVLMANISTLFSSGDIKGAEKIQKSVMNFGICGVAALSFGIGAVADDFIPIFFGDGYESCILLVKLFSVVMVCKAISNYTRSAFLIPQKQDGIYIVAVISGGIVNIIVNTVLILWLSLGAMGATIGTLIAEFVVCVVQIVKMIQKESSSVILEEVLQDTIYVVFGFAMLFAVQTFRSITAVHGVVGLLLEIPLGAIVYIVLCALYWKRKPEKMPEIVGEKWNQILRRICAD